MDNDKFNIDDYQNMTRFELIHQNEAAKQQLQVQQKKIKRLENELQMKLWVGEPEHYLKHYLKKAEEKIEELKDDNWFIWEEGMALRREINSLKLELQQAKCYRVVTYVKGWIDYIKISVISMTGPYWIGG